MALAEPKLAEKGEGGTFACGEGASSRKLEEQWIS